MLRFRRKSSAKSRRSKRVYFFFNAAASAVQMVSSPEIGPFACDPGHRLGSIWSAITDSFKGRFQVMHTQKQHWLDYDPVALRSPRNRDDWVARTDHLTVCEIGLCSATRLSILLAEAPHHCPKRSSKVLPAGAMRAGACQEAPITRLLERLKAFIRSTLSSPNRNS